MSTHQSWKSTLRSKLTVDGSINWTPYFYVLPALLLYAIFLVYPFLRTFLLSFQQVQTLGAQREWVGLQNYNAVLTDPLFWRSAGNTLIFTIGMIFIPLVIGLGLAILLDKKIKAAATFRSLIFIPVVVPVVVAGFTFQWILSSTGLLNWILVETGIIAEPMRFLNSSTWALPSVLTMVIWKRVGYYMVILLAGLQAIPDDMYEAAKVMGKSRWEMFRYITVPLLKPAILITVVIGIIDSVKAFAHVYVMTKGGPSHASEILSTYFYKVTFSYYQFGKGAAFGFILFAIALVLSMIVIRKSGGAEI